MKYIEDFLLELSNLDIKLWAEGDRLCCDAPKNVLTPELRAELVEHKTEILPFLRKKAIFEQPIRPISRDEELPISFAQQRLWFLNKLEGPSATYNMQAALRLEGPLHQNALEQSLQTLVQRHENLRTAFPTLQGFPMVQISESPSQLSVLNLTALLLEEQQQEVQRLVNDDAIRPFDLEKGPLFRATLLQLGANSHVLLLNMHHIISDGWSIGVLIREWSVLYKAFVQDQPSPLPPLPIQYVDFAHWQRQWLQGDVLQQQVNYWKQQLANAPALLELPTDHPRPPVQRFQGANLPLSLSPELTAQLKSLSQQTGSTLFMTLLSAFATLLSRYSGQSDIVIGSPIANRTHRQTESLIGFFVNTLVLRLDLSGNPPFDTVLQQARRVALEAYTHQDIPFEQLVEELKPARNMSHSPLFQVMLVLQNAPMSNLEMSGVSLTPLEMESVIAKFEITLSLTETDQGLVGGLEYNTDLFESATIERLRGHLNTLLTGLVTNPQQPIHELPLLTEAEQQQLLAWNETATDYPRDKTLVDLFEEQVEQTPEAIAVIFEDQQLTYLQLNMKANQLAHYLQSLGVKPEVLVGICLERSLEMVIGLLGILKAGGAYLPLDPAYPAARLAFMLEEAHVPVLLTQLSLTEGLPETTATVVCLDVEAEVLSQLSTENIASEVGPTNLAYVIYTSGSTGKPKGVAVPHRAVNRLVFNTNYIKLISDDAVAQASNASFDAATFEIWGALLHGARLIGMTKDITLSPQEFVAHLREHEISVIFLTTALFNQLAREVPTAFKSVREVLFGGEAVEPRWVARVLKNEPPQRLLHVYGPTENTTFSSWYLVKDVPEKATTIPIGRPISNTQLFILDKYLQLSPIGVPGELHIGGAGLARGYKGRPELTAEKFIKNPFSDDPNSRLYKTGDLARYLSDGNIEYLGRIDNQVKIRGFRIELGEIEAVLAQHPALRENAVIVHEASKTDKRLVAYFVPHQGQFIENTTLRSFLTELLPDYMIPSVFVRLDAMPLTPNGKIDRRALPEPDGTRPQLEAAYVMPQTEAEQEIAQVWQKALQLEKVGIYDNFFEVGGHSLLMVQVQSSLQAIFGQPLSIVELFQYPTIHALAKHLTQDDTQKTSDVLKTSEVSGSKDIAIIGMSGRFPGAKDVDTFWQNLRDGVESITFFSEEELLAEGIDPALLNNPNYVKANGVLEDIELFDAAFFGYSPIEAEIMDPQQRLFLECAWEAIENAGYNVDIIEGAVSIYAGVGMNTYLLNNLYSNRDLLKSVGDYQLMISNKDDFMPTRTSYKLNLKGPSVNVQTACSTSLVAVHLAGQSLLNGECDMALAGGVTIGIPQKTGYMYQQDMIASPDGHCRAFDAKAQGTVGGSGVGIVVLKRLDQALADGDCIHAVIKGSAINNDGALKVGYTAPSVDGQAAVIAEAMREIDPETITYVETHGTGTTLGDPIEIAALTQAYQSHTQKKGFCAIGSVKTNVGHLDTAAGVTGLIKTVLALKHKMLPPSLHFEQPNPKIDFANSPFFVNTTLSEWKSEGTPHRAGVSSFGIGGTNAHVVLEEAPTDLELGNPKSERPWQLLVLSAKTQSALETTTTNLVEYLKQHPNINFADVAYTLSQGRKVFENRRMLVCRTVDEAMEALSTLEPGRIFTQTQESTARPVVFMFSGQGSQYVNMALELYQHEPIFREYVDKCAEILKPHLNLDLKSVLYPSAEQVAEASAQLEQTAIAQPALFVIEYALAQLWMAWGLRPVAMIGHSIGEYVAACLADVFSLEDALVLVAVRGQLMQSLPSGAMLSVPLPETEIKKLLNQELSLAAHNAPSQCVVSGTIDAITVLENQLTAQGVECIRLHTSHAFHSAMMEPILASFTAHVKKMRLNPPQIPYLSNVSGTWITAAEATEPDYWARHMRFTVRFTEGLQTLWNKQEYVLLEIGPGRTLTTLAKRHPNQTAEQMVFYSLRHPKDHQADISFLLTTLGKLWLAGVPIDWSGFYAVELRQRLPLPTYPFERQRYWIERSKHDVGVPQVSLGKKPDIADWFYRPLWKQSVLPVPLEPRNSASWLVFDDACGLGVQLVKKLKQADQEVITVKVGSELTKLSEYNYTLNPQKREDYDNLLKELSTINKIPKNIVHLWTVTPSEHPESRLEWVDKAQDLGFYSLLFLAQTLGAQNVTDKFKIVVVSNNIQPVTGEEVLCPEKATVLGAVKIIPLEYSNVSCRSIDVVIPKSGTKSEQTLINQLWAEFPEQSSEPSDLMIAYRGPYRWVQTFEPIRLEDKPDKGNARLKEEGVYLITGGLGGIGLTLAEHFAKTLRAKLILIGRSVFPARTDWEQWLSTHNEHDAVSLKIRKVQKLEKMGAEILVMSADVANLEQMQEVIAKTEKRFGQINGVIHCAGVIDYAGVIERRTSRETTDSILAPKVRGTVVLDSLLKDVELDFLVLCSSRGTTFYQIKRGEVGYCAANDFLDAFSYYKTFRDDTFTVTINWEDWQEVGMSVKATEQYLANTPGLTEAEAQAPLQDVLLPSEGIEVFTRILAGTYPRIAVSTRDLMVLIKEDKALTRQNLTSSWKENISKSTHSRPELSNAYMAPRDTLELQLTQIWEEVLNISPIGVHDNFFDDLNGHSLLALSIMPQINQQFGRQLPLATLFECATIEQLATILRQQTESEHWSSLVALQPKGSKPPFFCVPGSGGNVIYFQPLSHHLGTERPFYGLQAVGVDGESEPHTRIEDMAAHYIEAIQTVQAQGPYLLGGHSFGSKVAFEMSQQLQKQGHEVALLVILDTFAPLVNPENVDLDNARLVTRIASLFERLYGQNLEISYETLQSLELEEQLNYLAERLKMANLIPPKADIKQLRGVFEVTKANAKTRYVPQDIYPITRITLFQAEDQSFWKTTPFGDLEILQEPTWGWSQLSAEPVAIHRVPGDHITMMAQPHVQVLAEQLKICLEQATGGNL
jgi:amino acid adenylation domain-containing protein